MEADARALRERAEAAEERGRSLEETLRSEAARVAPLLGECLDALSMAQLASLAGLHEEGLQRARSLLVRLPMLLSIQSLHFMYLTLSEAPKCGAAAISRQALCVTGKATEIMV